MRTILTFLLLLSFGGIMRAQIPVTDVANLVNNQLSHVENIAKWIESIEQLRVQIRRLEEQIDIQDDIRRWTGDPVEAATSMVLGKLGHEDLIHDYYRAKYAIVRLERSLDSLQDTIEGNFRALSDLDLDGHEVRRHPMTHRRYTVLEAKRVGWAEAVEATQSRRLALQGELAETLDSIRKAETDAEVQKLSAKAAAINGQIDELSNIRRDELDQVLVQKIANDSRREQEQIAAAELEARDAYLANQRVSAYMRTLKLRQ